MIYTIESKYLKHCLIPELLELKIGARVMLLRNIHIIDGLINGSMGTVAGFDPEHYPLIQFDNGKRIFVKKMKLEIKVNGKVVSSRCQVPLRLVNYLLVT